MIMPACNMDSTYFHTIEMDRDEVSFIKTIIEMNVEKRREILFPVATDAEIENIDPAGAALAFKKLVEMEQNGTALFINVKQEEKKHRWSRYLRKSR